MDGATNLLIACPTELTELIDEESAGVPELVCEFPGPLADAPASAPLVFDCNAPTEIDVTESHPSACPPNAPQVLPLVWVSASD